MSARRVAVCLVLAVLLGVAAGWRAPDPAPRIAHEAPAVPASSPRGTPVAPVAGASTAVQLASVPADYGALQVADLAPRLAELDAMAARGRADAAHALYRIAVSCLDFVDYDDASLEQIAQRRVAKIEKSSTEDVARVHDAVFEEARARRGACALIPAERRARVLEYATRAVALGDRAATLALAMDVRLPDDDEHANVRHAEALVQLQAAIESNLKHWIESGDVEALRRRAAAENFGLLTHDFERSYADYYAYTLATDDHDFEDELARISLHWPAERIARAQARGAEIARAFAADRR